MCKWYFPGLLFDQFQDYRYGFWLAGGMIAVSGLMLFFIPLLQRKENRGRKEKELLKVNLNDNQRTNSMGNPIIANGLTSNPKLSSNNNLSEA